MNKIVNENEQWKLQGECFKCRKAKYCSKSCKAHDKHMDRLMSEAIARTTLGKSLSPLGGK